MRGFKILSAAGTESLKDGRYRLVPQQRAPKAPEARARLDNIRAEQMKKIQQRKDKEHE